MRSTVLGLLLLGATGAALSAEGLPLSALAGHWEGAASRLGAVQVLQIDLREEDGRLAGTVDVPALGLLGLPVENVRYEPPALRFKFIYGEPALTVDADAGEITGVIEAWEPDVRLHLKKMPPPPPSFREEEVAFRSGGVTLAGTLRQPLTPGPHPAVVLVHGSQQADRSNPRYRSDAILLARHGIAALVYDRRGLGSSTGDDEAATFDDLAADAAAAVSALRARRDVGKIGLIGYSQGGWLAPLAATKTDGIAFLVLVCGPAVSVEEQEVQRVRHTLMDGGASEEDVARAVAYTRKVFDAAYRGGSWEELAAATEKAKGAPWAETAQLVAAPADLEGWRRERFDPEPVLRRTTLPVLALFGGQDPIVPPSENAELMRRLLIEAGNRDVTIEVFPRAHHGLEQYGELRQGSWSWPTGYWLWGRRAPGADETLLGWIRERAAPRHTSAP